MHLGQADATKTEPSWWEKLFEGSTKLVGAVSSAQTARDIYKINKERAAQGLAPIDASAISPQVNFGVAPGTMAQFSTPLMIGAGLILLMILRKKL